MRNSTISEQTYGQLLSECRRVLAPLGFERKNSNFRIRRCGNVGIINFQKSQWGTKDEIQFTINLGVWSKRLSKFDELPPLKDVLEHLCHWRARIGDMLPADRDKWWQISHLTNGPELMAEVIEVIRSTAAPSILSRLSDANLAEHCARSASKRSQGVFLATARRELLKALRSSRSRISGDRADALANEAKHRTRKRSSGK